ncbi:MAG: phage/plasmid primase, P4 family, partial [Thiobacillus sp.]|nr:phage/plasmid primase, P4 family [Thiobacillus sp.]
GAAFEGKASFADLWTANVEALGRTYPAEGRPYDASSADAALAQCLSFWTGKDCGRIDRLMRQSALNRDKWERADYLPRTILGAVARQEEVLTDRAPVAVQAGAVGLQGVEVSLLQLGTQDSVAQIFARQVGGKMLYNHTRGRWLEWDGTRWRIEGTQKALNFARDLARTVNYDGKASLGSASFCAGVEQLAKADPLLSVKGSEFDRDNYLLNTPGGTFDLRTNTLRPHSPDDCISLSTAATPSPEGGAAFDKFLDEITMGDRELAEFLQVSLGECLSGAVESHWMLFWIGQGRNGKNTLGDLVQDAMGDYARKVPTSTLMAKAHETHPTEIANLQGVRLALSSEINDGEHWNEARINEVTGDATLSARFMRGDLFTFQRTHKHLIYGNHRPQLRTVGDAIKSRIKIVPFKASFLGREDADLPRRLREALGYVLAWLIEGHRKWLAAAKRLPPCKAVEAESADYFAAQSTVDMWLSERVQILAPDERNVLALPKGGELYRDYADWKKERGETPVSLTRWAESLRG